MTGIALDVVMPQMGVSVSEGTVTRWLKNVGDAVAADEPLLEISTDKVDTEVPSPGAGVLSEVLVHEGQTVAVGTLLGRLGGDATAPEPPSAEPPTPEPVPEPATQAAADEAMAAAEDGVREAPAPLPPEEEEEEEEESGGGEDGHRFVSPVVARIAAEHGLDPDGIEGTGRGGRVTKKDILAVVERSAVPAGPVEHKPPVEPAPVRPEPQVAAPVPEPAAGAPVPSPPPPALQAPSAALEPGETAEPMSAMRRGIAEHMRRSLDTAAHVTSAIEVDMSKVVEIRARLKPEYERAHGVNPTYLAFVARAAIDTMRDWPWVNAELRGESVVTRSFVNLGFAVALDGGRGLIVPVVKHAEGLNLVGMARAIADLADRARTKRLVPDDVQGGTFTITNPGGFGTFHGTPIISRPQAAILGTYALVRRPWVIEDESGGEAIAIRPVMNVTLTYDHRIVDGAYAGGFLRDLRERLVTWDEDAY